MAIRFSALSRRLRPQSLGALRSYASSSGFQDGDTPVSSTNADASSILTAIPTPVEAVTVLLDGIHSLTGAPWWLVIAGSTVAMKAMLFPLTVVQLQKLSKFGQFARKFPMLPAPGSKKTVREHLQEFQEKRKELGVPSPAWFLAAPAVQFPLFITWVMTVRWMAVDKHPGFESGGALWFSDLTVSVQEPIGAIFPTLLAATYIANIELSWSGVKLDDAGPMGRLVGTYRWWLRFCAVPIYVSSYYFPQAVFMYWLPNSVTTLAQTLLLKNKGVRRYLGLPIMPPPQTQPVDSEALIKAAAEHVARNERKKGIQILQYLVAKEPENATAHYALAKMHAEAELWPNGAKFFGLAAAKAKQDGLKIAAYLGLGIALRNQDKLDEAKAAFLQLSGMEVPENLESRKSYLMGIVCLASILNHEGNKLEALAFLEKAAKYDPSVGDVYVKQVKKELKELEQAKEELKELKQAREEQKLEAR